jgi:hypothetical protein
MYTLFANEKLGMPVEQIRLHEIRHEIESRRLADEVRQARTENVANSIGRWLNQVKALLRLVKWGMRQSKSLYRVG